MKEKAQPCGVCKGEGKCPACEGQGGVLIRILEKDEEVAEFLKDGKLASLEVMEGPKGEPIAKVILEGYGAPTLFPVNAKNRAVLQSIIPGGVIVPAGGKIVGVKN